MVVARDGVPAPTGHDKTSIVVFQRADAPGSLLASCRSSRRAPINLTKLESRPTKQALGDYCFLIDLEGHIADEVVADALRELKIKQGDVKFLGSYPAAGEHGPAVRRDADRAWRAADEWMQTCAPRCALPLDAVEVQLFEVGAETGTALARRGVDLDARGAPAPVASLVSEGWQSGRLHWS